LVPLANAGKKLGLDMKKCFSSSRGILFMERHSSATCQPPINPQPLNLTIALRDLAAAPFRGQENKA
jgi:hypothetical protein